MSLICLVPLLTIIPTADFILYQSETKLIFSHIFQLFFNYFYVAQFALAALALRERFKLLNNYLRFVIIHWCLNSFQNYFYSFSLSTKIPNRNFVMAGSKTLNSTLFIKLYNDLCDAIGLINSTFTNHLIFVMINFLSMNVFLAYTALREYFTQSKTAQFDIAVNGFWITISYSIKIFLAYVGSSTTNEAERTAEVIAKATGAMTNNDDLKASLNSFLIQMRFRNKNLENVFFKIDWKLILAVSLNSFLVDLI